MNTWAKVALVLAAGSAAGLLLRAVLPSSLGLDIHYSGAYHMVPLSRVVFWLCVVVALLIAGVLVKKNGLAL
jgi:hypothetical protein